MPSTYPDFGEQPWDTELKGYIDTADDEHQALAISHSDQTLDAHKVSADHDGRYYTQSQADQMFLSEAEGDARYVQNVDVAEFLTEPEGNALYYPRAEADAEFLTAAEGDALFLTQAEGDVRYAPIGGAGAGDNMGFENGALSPHAVENGAVFASVTTPVRSGKYAAQFTLPASAPTVGFFTTNGAIGSPAAPHPRVQGGDRWTFAVWMRNTGAVGLGVSVRLDYRDGAGLSVQTTTSAVHTVNTTYTRVGVSDVAPVGAVYVVGQLLYTDAAGGELLVDDMNLQRVLRPGLVSPDDFGGVGDSSHDDTKALQAAINFVRTKAGVPWKYVVDLGGKVYRITAGVEASGISTVGFTIQNGGILAACPGYVAMNFAGTQGLRLRNLRMWGDSVSKPDVGIYIGYADGVAAPGVVAVDCQLINCTLLGFYVRATIVALGAEVSNFTQCQFHNNQDTTTSYVYANVADFKALNANMRNDPDVTAFTNNGVGLAFSAAGTYRSNIGHYESQVNYKKNTTLGPAVLLHGVGSMRWEGGYVLVLDGGRECVRIDLRYSSAMYDCDFGFQAEQHPNHVFSVIADSGATEFMTGMKFRVTGVGPDAANIQSLMNVIGLGAGTLQMRGIEADLSNFNPSGEIFQPTGKVLLLGANITLQSTGVALGQNGSVRGIVHYAQGGNSALNPA